MNEATRVEYARRIDCAANGCEEPHADDGMVLPPSTYCQRPAPGSPQTVYKVNGHVVTWVQRTVTTSDWSTVDLATLA